MKSNGNRSLLKNMFATNTPKTRERLLIAFLNAARLLASNLLLRIVNMNALQHRPPPLWPPAP